MAIDKVESVLWSCPQNLTEEQKQQARENIGAGTGGGGSGDVVVMHLEDVMPIEITSDPIPAKSDTQIWEDMMDIILDGKALIVTMGISSGTGSCVLCNTFFDLGGIFTKEQAKDILRQNEDAGTINLMFEAQLYGGLVTTGVKIAISPTRGIVPVYYYVEAGETLSLEMSLVQSNKIIDGYVFGFAYDGISDSYTITYSNLLNILIDLQKRGKKITLTGSNKDTSYMFALAPVFIMRGPDLAVDYLILKVNTTATYEVPGSYYGEIRPIMWEGTFVYDSTLDNTLGAYKLSEDRTYVMDYTLVDSSMQ